MTNKDFTPANLPAQFSYDFLLEQLRDYKKPRDKIRSLIAKGDIVRVKKGLYVLNPRYGKVWSRLLVANLLYGPSYISMHTALRYWSAIPERVSITLSMTPKRSKIYETPIDTFQYYYCRMQVFQIGFSLTAIDGDHFAFMATREKALCDVVSKEKTIRQLTDIEYFLNGMRIEESFLQQLDVDALAEIAVRYRKKNVSLLLKYFKERLC